MRNNSTIPKKKGKSLFSKVIAWLHLWPSIVSGIILVFVCLTGTIIVYCDEIFELTAGEAKYVEVPQNHNHVPFNEIVSNVKKYNPNIKVSEYVFFKDPNRSIRMRAFIPNEKKLILLYANPYTGEIIKQDNTINFFFVMAHLHSSLLAEKIGGWIVAISTIIFVISTLTGLILWWPKKWTKTTRKASFTIKWKAKFKRFNYDLHNVYGFYSMILCLVLGMTGLMIFFSPLMNFTVKTAGGDIVHLEKSLPKADSTKISKDLVPFAYELLNKEFPNKKMVRIWESPKRQTGAYVFSFGKVGLKSIENFDMTIFDRYTGQKINVKSTLIRHEKVENIVWQLHMGQWFGQLGKISTFLAGIVATSLPITGFLIWLGRKKKKPKKV
ncbi:PepSY-associated TM helix domain-containing protein [Chishuiella sp.]|uniref:PepSY-associated TM helix domain-containing protein n=1 Tax=Chishuiella sp. TaxID=1969467 RepID=UPI0028A82C16|nr:PepSY-associated TM helix domain-containing protein [Chishuiella sp.]